MSLFGTDGIRGQANTYPITPHMAVSIGEAVASYIRQRGKSSKPQVIVGRDTRRSGSMLEAALCAGLQAGGIEVHLTGIIPTPGVAWLVSQGDYEMGMVLSASHNPAEDNGFKFFNSQGGKLSDEEELMLNDLILAQTKEEGRDPNQLGYASMLSHATKRYAEHLLSTVPDLKLDGLKISIDHAHGAASPIASRVFAPLQADVHYHYAAPNGDNINQDCGCTHPETLRRIVLEDQADVGIAFDGDADRVQLCDHTGTALDGDDLLAILALDLFKKCPPSEKIVVCTVMSNLGLDALIRNAGGKTARSGVGDKLVASTMKQTGARLGGEQSGHILLPEFNPCGDGLLVALQVLRLMKTTGVSLHELRQPLKKYPQEKRNIRMLQRVPLETMHRTMKKKSEIEDALKDDGRIFLRYSGTEPLLRVLIEGPNADQIQAYAKDIVSAVQKDGGL